MAVRRSATKNIIAGLFLLGSTALAVFISTMISDARESLVPTHTYHVTFTIDQGALGLKPGSPVLLGGFQVGRVTGVRIIMTPAANPPPGAPGEVPVGVDVEVKVRADLLLYEDAVALLQIPLLGSMSVINIASVGDGTRVTQANGSGALLEPGEALRGQIAPPAFLAQAGYGPQEANQLRAMITTANQVMARVDRLTLAAQERIEPTLESLQTTLEDVRTVTGDLRARTPEWSRRIGTTLDNVAAVSERVGPIADAAESRVQETRKVIATVQQVLDENAPTVKRTLGNVEAATVTVNEQSLPAANRALAGASDTAEQIRAMAADIAALMQQQRPSIERMLANFRLASDQFKLTAVEVRRNPWRLLYRPKTRELESELLYDAAQAYAVAVSDLRAASESLRAISTPEAVTGNAQAAEQIQGMTRQIREAFERYEQAERQLLERIAEQSS